MRYGGGGLRVGRGRICGAQPAGLPSYGLPPAFCVWLHAHGTPCCSAQVRPYLMADGGNVEFVDIDGPTVYLRLAGACGSCPSSLTTMTMGIKRRLMERIPVSCCMILLLRGCLCGWGRRGSCGEASSEHQSGDASRSASW